jgi:hypothetical protein
MNEYFNSFVAVNSRNIMYNRVSDHAIVRTPKTAQTTYARWLTRGKPEWIEGDRLKDRFYLMSDTVPQMHTFVRDPFDRLFSAWKYGKRQNWYRGLQFEVFILSRYWMKAPYEVWLHCLPCSYFTHWGDQQIVQNIYRFEDFNNEFRRLVDNLGMEQPDAIPILNTTGRADSRPYYTPEMRNVVELEMADDLIHFGYEF